MSKIPRRFLTAGNTVSIALITVAASIALVGVVWASTGAIGNDDTVEVAPVDSVPADNPDSPGNDDEFSSDPNERLDELTTKLEIAVADITDLQQEVSALRESSDSTQSLVRELESQIETVKSDVAVITKNVQELRKTVDGFDGRISAIAALVEKKTSQLNDEGKYIGTIAPSQISPQLRVSDISGDWPLNRTTGDLEVSKLYSDLFSCTSDSRNHAVLSIDAFRRMTCLRIPK
jgi:FtsZ-binding cell division protein ZapB